MEKPARRTAVSAADLFVLLDREFRRRQPRECRACYVPLPFRTDGPPNGRSNWEIVTPRCSWRCESVLQDLVQELQQRYELASAQP